MLRSLYSGVSGLTSHQSKMDVIGNNIANVNTYGFKGSRVTFRDIYYQTTKTATGTGTILDDRGSDNPDVDEDIKANILVSDAGSVKEADGATLTYSVKLSNAVG